MPWLFPPQTFCLILNIIPNYLLHLLAVILSHFPSFILLPIFLVSLHYIFSSYHLCFSSLIMHYKFTYSSFLMSSCHRGHLARKKIRRIVPYLFLVIFVLSLKVLYFQIFLVCYLVLCFGCCKCLSFF
jgi:hypothetical protein